MAVTETQIETMLKRTVAELETLQRFVASGATEFSSFYDHNYNLVVSGGPIDYQSIFTSAQSGLSTTINSLISPDRAATLLQPYLFNYRDLLNLPNNSSNDAIFDELYDHYITESKTLTKRDISYHAVSAGGSNTGTGTVYRYRTDKNGHQLGYAWADIKTIVCTSDANSGATRHKEQFEIRGEDATNYFFGLSDPTGGTATLTGMISETADIIKNANFFSSTGTGATLNIPNWSASGAITNFEILSNVFYRAVRETGAQSVVASGNDSLVQNLTNLAGGVRFRTDVPYHIQIAYKRQDSCDGTFRLKLGSAEVTVDLTTVSNDVWNVLVLSTSSNNAWFENWNEETLECRVGMTGSTSGSVVFQDLICKPCTEFKNHFYAVVGAQTRFLLDDVFTFEDEKLNNDGLIQKWISFAYNRILPEAASGTVSDPSLIVS